MLIETFRRDTIFFLRESETFLTTYRIDEENSKFYNYNSKLYNFQVTGYEQEPQKNGMLQFK